MFRSVRCGRALAQWPGGHALEERHVLAAELYVELTYEQLLAGAPVRIAGRSMTALADQNV